MFVYFDIFSVVVKDVDSPLPKGQITNDQFSSAVKWGSWGCLPHQGDGRFKCTDINTSKVLRIGPFSYFSKCQLLLLQWLLILFPLEDSLIYFECLIHLGFLLIY